MHQTLPHPTPPPGEVWGIFFSGFVFGCFVFVFVFGVLKTGSVALKSQKH
jgi:hypothetical protein